MLTLHCSGLLYQSPADNVLNCTRSQRGHFFNEEIRGSINLPGICLFRARVPLVGSSDLEDLEEETKKGLRFHVKRAN